jgi:replicative DNA helicase
MFRDTVDKIKENWNNLKQGLVNTIPFENFPALNKHIPGIIKGVYYIVTASSGVGKTQLTKALFVLEPYKYIKKNTDKKLKLKILYFALEESKEEFMLSLISNRLKVQHDISMSVLDLQNYSVGKFNENTLEKIEECQEYFEDLEKYLVVEDSIYNPTGIYKYVRDYSEKNGTHHYKTLNIQGKDEKVYSHYIPNNPNEFVIVITDHISLLQEEKDGVTGQMMNKHQTITKWSADYSRKQITKHLKYAVVNVQQQSADKEKMQFTNQGQSIESKLEPSLDGLADNKLTQRDALVVLGLFAPDRYEIRKHLGHDIVKLKDNYRCLKILKNRLGRPNLKKGLFFDGETNTFKELIDHPSNIEERD